MRALATGLLALSLVAGAASGARADEDLRWEFERLMALDFLGAGVVGMPYHGSWTVRPRGPDNTTRSVALDGVDAGTFAGAGWGLQLTTDAPRGVRLTFATLYHRGVLVDHALPLTNIESVEHAEAWFGAGWQHQWGRLSLHTQTLVGLDSTAMNAEAAPGGLTQGLGGSSTVSGAVRVSRFDLRLGQEVGVHVALGRSVMAFLGAQLDIDGQWHVRLGLGVGGFGQWFREAGEPRGR